jgi:cellulose synthase/poly-beta-1,6-N-acetylglucosamine synthase-like glycosyltransferase
VAIPFSEPVPGLPSPRPEGRAFLQWLIDEGLVMPSLRLTALGPDLARDVAGPLAAHGLIDPERLAAARAQYHGIAFVDPRSNPPDVRLLDRLGARACLREGLLPWREVAGEVIVLVTQPAAVTRHRGRLVDAFGPVTFALCTAAALEQAVAGLRAGALSRAAETLTPPGESCRTLPKRPSARVIGQAATALLLGSALLPGGLLGVLAATAVLAMLAGTALKALALMALLRRFAPPAAQPVSIARLPAVSVLVPLLREADIAPRLIRRLGRLDYPRDLLDIILIVEDRDSVTRRALAAAGLPAWMRVLTVPHGTLKTKPRALNYALDFCRGSLIGVYDAEDAPAADQIRRIVERFHQRDARVACLQGVLDFYNPQTNWLARCFTMEYASWFRVVLPGLARLGLPVPLGGTTLFFRRAALEAVGGWDAHNVTEDADLGMRLHRHGYRTELIATVTREEANCHTLPWIRQRSRWIKGYMMTWRVHMRDPAQLWRDLGPAGFIGFQVIFLGSILHALLAPVLISFWLQAAGWPHPVGQALPFTVLLTLVAMFLLAEAANLVVGSIGLRRSGQRIHPLWLLTLHLYHPLASFAALKALWEVLWRPFYWDKTRHGRHDSLSGA